MSGNQKFKNVATERFHDYFYPKLKDGEMDVDQFFIDFDLSGSNRMQFFSALRSGHRSVTVEQLQIAWEKYSVSPNFIFGLSDNTVTFVAEPASVYEKSVLKDLKKLREAIEALEKKIKQ